MSDLQIPPCPTCSGEGSNPKRVYCTDWDETVDRFTHTCADGAHQSVACSTCNGSGYHPDTIKRLSLILAKKRAPGLWENWQEEWKDSYRHDVIAVLDALTGDTHVGS